MKNTVIRILKNSKILYYIYSYLGTICINVLKVFIPIDNKLILFVSYGGKKYDDSPKAIFKYIKDSKEYKNYNCVWAFKEPHNFDIEGAEIVKIDTFKYYITVLKARYWISNTSVKRGLVFNKKNVFNLNTWHGTPIKKIGADIDSSRKTFKPLKEDKSVNAMLAQSKYEVNIITRAFNINKDRVYLSGLPRNDELVSSTINDKYKIRNKLGIGKEKKVILYAPTYREYDKDSSLYCYINPPISLKKLKEVLGEKYIFLLRAHHEIGKVLMSTDIKDFVIDVSDYHSINDLLIVSDILISDYSSIFFDFSLLKKPMICFAYDLEQYKEERGLYLDLDKEIPGGVLKTDDDLINAICKMDYSSASKLSEAFCCKYVDKFGNASKEVVERIIGL